MLYYTLSLDSKLIVYGSAFFTGSLKPNSIKSSILCHIGVNDLGIHIINMKTKVSNLTVTPLSKWQENVSEHATCFTGCFFYSENKYMY